MAIMFAELLALGGMPVRTRPRRRRGRPPLNGNPEFVQKCYLSAVLRYRGRLSWKQVAEACGEASVTSVQVWAKRFLRSDDPRAAGLRAIAERGRIRAASLALGAACLN